MTFRPAAFFCVYDDDEWLPCSIASIYGAFEKIYFFVSNRPWNGPQTDSAKTVACIKDFPDPENKLALVSGAWASEVEQRNFALEYMLRDGFTHAFIIDGDEIYDPSQLRELLSYAEQRPEVDCWHLWFIVYWKSPRYRIDPPEKHNPPVLMRIGSGTFVEYRNCRCRTHQLIPPQVAICHHLSYARSDAQIKRKLGHFSHADQVRPDWFESVWKAWDRDQTIRDLCPYNPGVFDHTAEVPEAVLPPVLQAFLRGERI